MDAKCLNEFSIKCGKATDSIDKLEELCREEIEKLIKNIDIQDSEVLEIPCWTSEIVSELIGVGYVRKKGDGGVECDFDFSESTL